MLFKAETGLTLEPLLASFEFIFPFEGVLNLFPLASLVLIPKQKIKMKLN